MKAASKKITRQRTIDEMNYLFQFVKCKNCGEANPLIELLVRRIAQLAEDFGGKAPLDEFLRVFRHENARCSCGSEDLESLQ